MSHAVDINSMMMLQLLNTVPFAGLEEQELKHFLAGDISCRMTTLEYVRCMTLLLDLAIRE